VAVLLFAFHYVRRMFWQVRDSASSANMQQAFRGHFVVLIDQLTYSDGETFSAGVKALTQAPLIGKRTAGAAVWLRGQNRSVGGGIARVAEYPQFRLDGHWIVEGIGVAPDIEVDNLPHATFKGEAAQLNTAVGYLNQRINKASYYAIKSETITEDRHL